MNHHSQVVQEANRIVQIADENERACRSQLEEMEASAMEELRTSQEILDLHNFKQS